MMAGAYPMMNPIIPNTEFLADNLLRTASKTHKAAINVNPSSKLHRLNPDTNPKRNNFFALGEEQSAIEKKRLIKMGIERKYQE